jgi:hypothetical protein
MMSESNRPLGEVLNALALAMPTPNAEILEQFVRRYPEHADELTEFAVELAVEFGGESDEDEDLPVSQEVSPAVGKAISHLQNYTFELERKAKASTPSVTDPFGAMTREQFRAFASDLGVNTTFAMKLRDRSIDPQTIIPRTRFCQAAADAAQVPMDVMVAHLQGAPAISRSAFYKADGKPEAAPRESFEQAVQSSALSEEQQRQLLDM